MDELPEDVDENEEKYLWLPYKNDLDLGKHLVMESADKHMPEDVYKIEDIFRHSGAYRRFKDLLEERGQLEDWYDFENAHVKEALLEWCRENSIELEDV